MIEIDLFKRIYVGKNLDPDEIRRVCSDLLGKDPIYHGTKKEIIGQNWVGAMGTKFLSDTNSAINWHSEAYDQDDIKIDYVCFYCVQKSRSGGETCIVDFRKIRATIEFEEMKYKKVGGDWSNWIPVFKNDRLRFSLSAKNKNVVFSKLEIGELELSEILERAMVKILLRPGELLVINNRNAIHSRKSYQGERLLRRLVF